jgi:hypothetical protein
MQGLLKAINTISSMGWLSSKDSGTVNKLGFDYVARFRHVCDFLRLMTVTTTIRRYYSS